VNNVEEPTDPFKSLYSHYSISYLEDAVPTPMDDVPEPEPEQKLNVLGEPVNPPQWQQDIVEGVTDFGRRIIEPFTSNPAVQGPVKGATDLVNQISSLDNELGQVLGVYDRDRQPMQIPDITEDMPVSSQGGKDLIASLTQFMIPFGAAGGFSAAPLTIKSITSGAMADMLFDPEKGNLWTLAEQNDFMPELSGYLSAKVDEEAVAEERLLSRLKTVFTEGGPLGVAADFIFKVAKAGKQIMGLGGEEVTPMPLSERQKGPDVPPEIQKDLDEVEAKMAQNQADYASGAITAEELAVRQNVVMIEKDFLNNMLASAKSAKREGTDVVRDFDRVDDALRNAAKAGDILPETAEFARWVIRQGNQRLVDDMAISIRQPTAKMQREGDIYTKGSYDYADRLVTIFKQPLNAQTTRTAVHEFMHHAEKMLPPSVQDEIRKLWEKSLIKEIKSRGDSVLTDDQQFMAYIAHQKGLIDLPPEIKQIVYGHARDKDYRYIDPSEFWAEHASEILAGKWGGGTLSGRAIGEFKHFMKSMLEKLKAIVGFDNKNALYVAINKMLKGERIKEAGIVKTNKESELVRDVITDPAILGKDPSEYMLDTQKAIKEGK